MKRVLAALLLLAFLTIASLARQAPTEPTDDAIAIQALQGQIQFLNGQVELQRRAALKLQAHITELEKACMPEQDKPTESPK